MFKFLKKQENIEVPTEQEEQPVEFIYPLTLEEWIAEFKVASRAKIDSVAEEDIKLLLEETERARKEIIIRNFQRYTRLNQNHKIL